MKLTKREAIRECKRLWKEIGKSGLRKGSFLCSPAGKKWLDKGYQDNCPLCECFCCRTCPLMTQYGKGCFELGYQLVGHGSTRFLDRVKGLKE